MANVIDGSVTLRQCLFNTQRVFGTRYFYKERDVLKRIIIRKVTHLSHDRPGEPIIKYEISTRSYPQYDPYIRGKTGVKQRKYHHDYETVLEMDELSIDTLYWKARVGTGKLIRKAPKNEVETISRETRHKWALEKEAKLKKAKTPEEKEKIRQFYRDKAEKHKKGAKYKCQGDYVAKALGVNLDFAYRDAYAFKFHGHLYGKWEFPLTRPSKLNPYAIMFCPKHLLRIIETLLARGILKG